MKLCIIGSSHVGALKHGLEAIPLYGEIDCKISGFIFGKDQQKPFHRVRPDGIDLVPAIERRDRFHAVMGAEDLRKDGTIYGVCMFPHSETFYANTRWKDEDPAILNYYEHVEHPIKFLQDCRASHIPCFAISTPHPNRNHNHPSGLERIRWLDRMLRGETAAMLRSIPVDWVMPPRECMDEQGFIKDDYANPDKFHANGAYGALYMKKILDYVSANYTGA